MPAPGGGLGNPIDTPDPLSKYKYWILSGLALVLVAVAAFLLRKPGGATESVATAPASTSSPANPATGSIPAASNGRGRNQLLLDALKEELFAIESEKIAGTLSDDDYAQLKPALETVLRRALKRQG